VYECVVVGAIDVNYCPSVCFFAHGLLRSLGFGSVVWMNWRMG